MITAPIFSSADSDVRFVVSRGGRLLSLSFCSTVCNVLCQTKEGGLIAPGDVLTCGGVLTGSAMAGGVLAGGTLTGDALTGNVLTGDRDADVAV